MNNILFKYGLELLSCQDGYLFCLIFLIKKYFSGDYETAGS